jgi:hypothetical protein
MNFGIWIADFGFKDVVSLNFDKERLRRVFLGYLGWSERLHLLDWFYWLKKCEKVRKNHLPTPGKNRLPD